MNFLNKNTLIASIATSVVWAIIFMVYASLQEPYVKKVRMYLHVGNEKPIELLIPKKEARRLANTKDFQINGIEVKKIDE